MEPKQEAFKNQVDSIIEKLELRGMEGFYCENKVQAAKKIVELMKRGSSVTWGGSETLKEINIFEILNESEYILYDRSKANTLQEKKDFYAKAVTADYFLMSTNAITLDGQLVNIDGSGNRVACLITGPENVIIVAGKNKIAIDVENAIERVKNFAAPPNAVRLNQNTPCKELGRCTNCLTDDCICCQTVITRKSRIPNRIKVILVGEELGY